LQTETFSEAPRSDEDGGAPLEVAAGTLVVLHGALPHYRLANRRYKARYAYTLHVISRAAFYPKDNGLVPAPNLRPLGDGCVFNKSR